MLTLPIYRFLYPILLFLLRILKFFNPKLKKGFELRKRQNNQWPWLTYQANTQPLWFHCASGEFEYAKPVIREIKKNHPQQKILVTFFSPSVEKSLSQFPEVDFYCPCPWDKVKLWSDFIDHHNPRALLIARTDLWPAMLEVARKKQVPRLLFSKTVNQGKSSLHYLVSAPLMRKFNDIFCVSKKDQDLLYKQLKPFSQIHASGDTRYDQCLHRIHHGKTLKPLNNFNKPLFIAGSTWPKDEQIILPVIKELQQKISFIIAPHEPTKEHLKNITDQLEKQNLNFSFYSQINNWNPDHVLIIDQVGILADLYAWSSMSFVGGSMNRSVHSVLEPLAQGNLCFVGPKHHNNREALSFKQTSINGLSPVQEVRSPQELLDKIRQGLKHWSTQNRLDLQMAVRKRAGASKIVYKWCEKNQRPWANV